MKQKQMMMKDDLNKFLKSHSNEALVNFDAMFGENTPGENVPNNLIE